MVSLPIGVVNFIPTAHYPIYYRELIHGRARLDANRPCNRTLSAPASDPGHIDFEESFGKLPRNSVQIYKVEARDKLLTSVLLLCGTYLILVLCSFCRTFLCLKCKESVSSEEVFLVNFSVYPVH